MRALLFAVCLCGNVLAGDLAELRSSVTIARGVALRQPGQNASLEASLPAAEQDLAAAERLARVSPARADELATAPLARMRSELARCTTSMHAVRSSTRRGRLLSTASR